MKFLTIIIAIFIIKLLLKLLFKFYLFISILFIKVFLVSPKKFFYRNAKISCFKMGIDRFFWINIWRRCSEVYAIIVIQTTVERRHTNWFPIHYLVHQTIVGHFSAFISFYKSYFFSRWNCLAIIYWSVYIFIN